MIRSIRPTDLAVLTAFNRRAFPNEAKTRSGIAEQQEGALPLGKFLEQWLSLEENRHTWIDIEKRKIKGLVSVRNRWGQSVWEIDRLLLSDQGASDNAGLRLLNYLSAVGGEVGIQKVFLRLPCESLLVEVGKQAGFFPYMAESFYRLTGNVGQEHRSPDDAALQFRPLTHADYMNVFHLYSASVPTVIRQAEAMTFQEWKETREKAAELRRKKETLVEKNGQLVGYIQTAEVGRVGQLELLVSLMDDEQLGTILNYGLGLLSHKAFVVCFVPEYQARLGRVLERYGFECLGDFYSLVRQLAARVRQPRLVPMRA